MEDLIYKYLDDTLTEEEFHLLKEALRDPTQREIFKKQFRDHYHLLRALIEPDIEEGYGKVWDRIHYGLESQAVASPQPTIAIPSPKAPRRVIGIRWFAYAAAIGIALILAWGYLFRSGIGETTMPDFSKLVPAWDDIVLELADGSREVIQPGDKKTIVDGQGNILGLQNQNLLDFSAELATDYSDEVQFHSLLVPYGQRFDVLLADGTKVHLQAGTTLRFPARFDGQEFRKVEVEGEAFFEVARDEEHPFIVKAHELQVRVTGTQFYVMAYPEDPRTDVVLVEGGVQLTTEGNDQQQPVELSPGVKASLDRHHKVIEMEEVVTEIYTSWMEEALVFRQMPFDQIEKKLERYYNIEIINENTNLSKTVFNAHFKNETIANVLSFFSDSYDLSFEIRGNKVYIK